VTRTVWFTGGWVSVALGSVGVIVPGLPTTVFFIIAAGCFSRSSPRFEQWVLDLPKIGPMVRDHRAGLGMSRRAKRIAIGTMWAAIALSSVLLRDQVAIVVLVVLAGLVGTWYLVRRVPQREAELARRSALPAQPRLPVPGETLRSDQ
jgi:uncharacterized membrane protein YbaN (DUF454 family)